MSDRLIDTKPSKTAKIVCYMRALGFVEVGPPVANDYLAARFLSPAVRVRLEDPAERAAIMANEIQIHNYSYLTARTRHLDKWMLHALDSAFDQVVFLGAGYDSRSYRFADRIPAGTRIFEVDAPTTQTAKRKYLGWAEIDIPTQLTFVSIHFDRETILDVLIEAGYDPSGKTLFIWEGVTYYITPEAVDQTLAIVRDHAGQGSVIAFDYMTDRIPNGEMSELGAAEAAAAVSEAGEPFVFGLPDKSIGSFLNERGLTLIEHFTPDEFQATYLDDRFEPPFGFMLNAVARVGK